MEQLFSKEINPNLDETELVAILREFQEDFNQKHFVRNDSFKKAADGITGEQRRIFIEFLERSCTAEFSGFLLYKELGRRLKKTAPVAAEIFTLMSRDEAATPVSSTRRCPTSTSPSTSASSPRTVR